MKIEKIENYHSGLSNITKNNNRKDTTALFIPNFRSANDKFEKISFCANYVETLKYAATTTFKNDREVENAFITMFESLIKDSSVVKHSGFEELVKLYQRSGFRGLLNELWKAYPSKEISAILPADFEARLFAGEKDKPVLQIFNGGRQGFWSSIFNSKNATRDMELMFTDPTDKYVAEFHFRKNGNLETIQRNNDTSVWSEFYAGTGVKKQETTHSPYGFPDTTYYKKDGTLDTVENHIHGGPAIPLW